MTDPAGVCPAPSIPRPLLITLQTLLAASVPAALCTSRRGGTSGQIIPGKRHGIPNTGKSRFPVFPSVVCRMKKEARRRRRTRVPSLGHHAGDARSGFLFQQEQVALTLGCQVIALHNYSGIIPPPARRGCAPGTGSSSSHSVSLSERLRIRQLLTLSRCPPRAAHLPSSFCPGQGSAASPLQERSVCPATPS